MWHLWHPQVLLFTENCSPIHHHRLLGGQKILDDLDLMCTSYFHWLISCSTMWGPCIGVFSITKRKSFPYKELDRGSIGETGGYAKTFRHGPSCNSSQNLCVLLAVALGEIWGINIINAITILFARSSGIWKHEIVIRLQTAPHQIHWYIWGAQAPVQRDASCYFSGSNPGASREIYFILGQRTVPYWF